MSAEGLGGRVLVSPSAQTWGAAEAAAGRGVGRLQEGLPAEEYEDGSGFVAFTTGSPICAVEFLSSSDWKKKKGSWGEEGAGGGCPAPTLSLSSSSPASSVRWKWVLASIIPEFQDLGGRHHVAGYKMREFLNPWRLKATIARKVTNEKKGIK